MTPFEHGMWLMRRAIACQRLIEQEYKPCGDSTLPLGDNPAGGLVPPEALLWWGHGLTFARRPMIFSEDGDTLPYHRMDLDR